MWQLYCVSCILMVSLISELSTLVVATMPDYVSEDANSIVHMSLKNCGNGKLDPGEECDCGPGVTKCREDPCCQTTCQLKLHAQCSDNDPCCEKCKFKNKGSICEMATHDCGISQYCAGDIPGCPAVTFKRNGANCTAEYGNGICIYGVCKSFNQPCHQDTWKGSESEPPEENLSQCSYGSICINQSCVPIKEFNNGKACPVGKNGLECSGQGECTSMYHCHCDVGWKGSTCSVIDDKNSSKINNEKPGIVKGMGPEQRDSTSNTTALVGGLCTFVICVSIFFVIMACRFLPSRPKDDSVAGPSSQPDLADPDKSADLHHHSSAGPINTIP